MMRAKGADYLRSRSPGLVPTMVGQCWRRCWAITIFEFEDFAEQVMKDFAAFLRTSCNGKQIEVVVFALGQQACCDVD